jgi:hypothetical protein
MTGITDFYCDFCNEGRERRTPPDGQEFAQGYAQAMLGLMPTGWWEVPGKGADGGPGHACPMCVTDADIFDMILELRDQVTRRIIEGHAPTEDAAPFEGVDEATPSEGAGEAAPADTSDNDPDAAAGRTSR